MKRSKKYRCRLYHDGKGRPKNTNHPPFTQEHDEYVFRKQIPIPLGMGFTISQSRFPINSKFLVFASY